MDETAGRTLAAAVERLVARGVLDRDQAEAVRSEFAAAPPPAGVPRNSLLIEVGGYVGAAFVVAAVAALVGPNWNDLPERARLGVVGIPALLLAIAAYVVTTGMPGGWSTRDDGRQGPRRRLVAVLLTAAGGLAGGVAGVALDGSSSGGKVVSLVLLAAWALGYVAVRGSLLHLATAAALGLALGTVVDPSSSTEWIVCGLVLVAGGVAWAALTLVGVVTERPLGLFSAGVLIFVGAELTTSSNVNAICYALLAGLAAAGLAAYVRTRELATLVVGGVALAVVVPQAVIDYAGGGLGAAGVLLVCGLSVVGASALAMRLHRAEAEEATAEQPRV